MRRKAIVAAVFGLAPAVVILASWYGRDAADAARTRADTAQGDAEAEGQEADGVRMDMEAARTSADAARGLLDPGDPRIAAGDAHYAVGVILAENGPDDPDPEDPFPIYDPAAEYSGNGLWMWGQLRYAEGVEAYLEATLAYMMSDWDAAVWKYDHATASHLVAGQRLLDAANQWYSAGQAFARAESIYSGP